jgi:hypothetical protein
MTAKRSESTSVHGAELELEVAQLGHVGVRAVEGAIGQRARRPDQQQCAQRDARDDRDRASHPTMGHRSGAIVDPVKQSP